MVESTATNEHVIAGLQAAADAERILAQARADLVAPRRTTFPFHRSPPLSSANEVMADELVKNILHYEQSGRAVAAAMGIVRLRMHFDALERTESWDDFVRRHLKKKISDVRIAELIGAAVHKGGVLRCSRCNTATYCACGCGVPYIGEHPMAEAVAPPAKKVSVTDRAMASIRAHPEWSNRKHAAEIGSDHKIVNKVRRAMAEAPPEAPPRKHRPKNHVQDVNAFHGELVGFLNDFSARFAAWQDTAPEIDDEGKATLMQAFYLCSDGLARTAQQLDGR